MSEVSLKSTLFEEKSLGALLKAYESAFPVPLLAKSQGIYVGLSTFWVLLVLWYFKGMETSMLQKASGLMAGYALTVSSALMGVVIAGMSIFAASLKPKVANGLIETKYPGTEISALKFIFSMFAYLLFSLFVVVAACGLHYIALGDSALILDATIKVYGSVEESDLFSFFLVMYVSAMLGLIVFLGSLLKSFIWNLHQVLLVVAAFNGHVDEG